LGKSACSLLEGRSESGSFVSEFTVILSRAQQGDAEELLPLVYHELRRVAAVMMAREAHGQTLQPTALVHEAWLRLAGEDKDAWAGRPQFFAAAAEAMRRILIEKARSKGRIKRGGGWERINLEGLDVATAADDETVLVVNEALDRLEAQDPMKANLVKLRFFAGLTAEESAPVLGVSVPTVKRHWRFARAWLLQEIEQILKIS
jgi:RNA polymerase sigma factor (TIGR02999 family)